MSEIKWGSCTGLIYLSLFHDQSSKSKKNCIVKEAATSQAPSEMDSLEPTTATSKTALGTTTFVESSVATSEDDRASVCKMFDDPYFHCSNWDRWNTFIDES